MKDILVIYHRADFDGIFCHQIARKFLGDAAEYVGWDHGEPRVPWPAWASAVYVLDLPPQCLEKWSTDRLIWIDHHASAIAANPEGLAGYRIEGVAACRLAWQWFANQAAEPTDGGEPLPELEEYGVLRQDGTRTQYHVMEPYAVRLAGEYDVWDRGNPDAAVFQFGLRAADLEPALWTVLLDESGLGASTVQEMLNNGRLLQRYQQGCDAEMMGRACLVRFEGLTFLALNAARGNSLTFAAKDVRETGHDALMLFYWRPDGWRVSLYHARGREEMDLLVIAVKYGGGGHRGACGFGVKGEEFLLEDAQPLGS